MITHALSVDSVRGPMFVQDGGRPGAMHHGVPEGGALVPELLASSNLALGNVWNAAALEIFGGATFCADAHIDIALDGERHTLTTGQRFIVEPSRATRVRYLAIDGGIDVPVQLGGRGTLLNASLGGLDGRAVRRNDQLVALTRSASSAPRTNHLAFDAHAAIRVVTGPDLVRFAPRAIDTLLSANYTISAASDRVGARLEGPGISRLDADDGGSRPMVRGAIEVPAGGTPIVLGPDHPTTGGYPVIAVVIRADHGVFAARRPGATVRFTDVSVAEARALSREYAARWFSAVP